MSAHVVEVYQDALHEWRWRVKSANGEIVAEGESYTRKTDAVRGARDAGFEDLPVEEK